MNDKNNAKKRFLLLFTAKFHQISLQEGIDVAVHDALYVGGLIIGAVVFHTAVVEDVATDLAAPFNLHLARLNLVLLLHTVTHLAVVEL